MHLITNHPQYYSGNVIPRKHSSYPAGRRYVWYVGVTYIYWLTRWLCHKPNSSSPSTSPGLGCYWVLMVLPVAILSVVGHPWTLMACIRCESGKFYLTIAISLDIMVMTATRQRYYYIGSSKMRLLVEWRAHFGNARIA